MQTNCTSFYSNHGIFASVRPGLSCYSMNTPNSANCTSEVFSGCEDKNPRTEATITLGPQLDTTSNRDGKRFSLRCALLLLLTSEPRLGMARAAPHWAGLCFRQAKHLWRSYLVCWSRKKPVDEFTKHRPILQRSFQELLWIIDCFLRGIQNP